MKQSYIKYISSLLLFGSNGIVASFIPMSSYEIVLLRTMIGSLLLIAIFFLSKSKFTFYQHKKQFAFLFASGIAMGASWMFQYEGYQQVGISITSLCYYCGPVIIMVLSPIIFKEKITWVKMVGLLSIIFGIFLVNGQELESSGNLWGIFCGVMTAVMYDFMIILNKQAKNITGLENAMFQLFVSFLTTAVFVGMKQGYAMHIEKASIVPIFILGLINTGVGCYLYFSSIGNLPAQTVAICDYLEPLSAIVCSIIILKEVMVSIQVVGAVFIISGAIFGECFKKLSTKTISVKKHKNKVC